MYRAHSVVAVLFCLLLAAGQLLAAEPSTRGISPADEFSEGFEDVDALFVPGGWVEINNSVPLGTTGWGQGLPEDEFPAHNGPADSYISANFNNAGGAGTISNWLLTPEVQLQTGTRIEFWTRRVDSPFADRLEVRLSTSGASTDVGLSALSTGDFGTLLRSINPELGDDYPVVWTRFSILLDGIEPGTTGRIAFRYFVTDSGPQGSLGDYIGIDTFSVEQPLFTDRFEVLGF